MRPVIRNLLAGALLAASAASSAAFPVPPDSLRAARAAVDTAARRDTVHLLSLHDTTARRDTLRARPTHSPSLAMLFSAVVPGAGQFYNRSYWKVPVVLGFGLYFASTWLDQNRRTQDYRAQYAASVAAGNPDPLKLQLREFYKEQRDTFAWYFVILYFVNIADAYVDASLYNFDVGPDLTLRVLPAAPGPAGPGPGLTLRLGF